MTLTGNQIAIARDVRQMAIDAGDNFVANACTRVIHAGIFKSEPRNSDLEVVNTFAEMLDVE